MSGLIGKKIGMTSIYDNVGNNVAVTVIEVEPNVIIQIKTVDHEGYDAVQLGTVEKKQKSTSKALYGHFKKANTTPKKYVSEFRDFLPDGLKEGDEIKVEDVFQENSLVDVIGISKGKGYQGVVKRHGFGGVGGQTHGQHNRSRAPGSIGQASYPSRVFKGLLMAGQTGNNRVKIKDLTVVKVIPESNLLLVKGAVPGPKGQMVEIYNS